MKAKNINKIDEIVISNILKVFYSNTDIKYILDKISSYSYDNNSEGHWGNFNYKDRDSEVDNFWNRDQSLVRKFISIISLNNIERFGVLTTFFDGRPFSTELFTMGIGVPDKIDTISIVTTNEL